MLFGCCIVLLSGVPLATRILNTAPFLQECYPAIQCLISCPCHGGIHVQRFDTPYHSRPWLHHLDSFLTLLRRGSRHKRESLGQTYTMLPNHFLLHSCYSLPWHICKATSLVEHYCPSVVVVVLSWSQRQQWMAEETMLWVVLGLSNFADQLIWLDRYPPALLLFLNKGPV